MIQTVYKNIKNSMNSNNEGFDNKNVTGVLIMSLLISIIIFIIVLYIGKLLWNCCLSKNIQGVKPLNSWVDLLGIYILVRILICN